MFNRRTSCEEESVHVVFYEDENAGFQHKDIALEDETKVKDLEQSKEITTTHPKDLPKELRTQKDLSLDNIICEISKGVSLALDLEFYGNNMAFVS